MARLKPETPWVKFNQKLGFGEGPRQQFPEMPHGKIIEKVKFETPYYSQECDTDW